jgi:hypothetical protein
VRACDLVLGLVAWLVLVVIVLAPFRAAAIADKQAEDALRREREHS